MRTKAAHRLFGLWILVAACGRSGGEPEAPSQGTPEAAPPPATAAPSASPSPSASAAPSAESGTAKPPVTACASDADCRLFSDYCTDCDYRALAQGDPEPHCDGPGVRCLVDPCQDKKRAVCSDGKCLVAYLKSAAPAQ